MFTFPTPHKPRTLTGAVTAALTRAETQGLDPAQVLRDSWNEQERGTADDVGAVLSHRMERRIETAPVDQAPAVGERPAVPAWIADRRVLDAAGTDPAWRDHLAERYEYLAVRLEVRGSAIAVEQPGVELAARVAALQNTQAQSTQANGPEAGRQKPVTALDAR